MVVVTLINYNNGSLLMGSAAVSRKAVGGKIVGSAGGAVGGGTVGGAGGAVGGETVGRAGGTVSRGAVGGGTMGGQWVEGLWVGSGWRDYGWCWRGSGLMDCGQCWRGSCLVLMYCRFCKMHELLVAKEDIPIYCLSFHIRISHFSHIFISFTDPTAII